MASAHHSADAGTCPAARPGGPRSDLFFFDVPELPRNGVGDDHDHHETAADAPDLHHVGVLTAEHAVADAVDDDPEHKPDAGQHLVELQPAMLHDHEVTRA